MSEIERLDELRVTRALAGLVSQIVARTDNPLVGLLRSSGDDRAGRRRVVVALSGTSDNTSRAYKTAQRQVERYWQSLTGNAGKQARSPYRAGKRVQEIAAAALIETPVAIDVLSTTIIVDDVEAVTDVSDDTRQRHIEYVVEIPDTEMERVLNSPNIARAFIDTYGDTYVSGMSISHIENIEIGIKR